jgi:hypothetical protein
VPTWNAAISFRMEYYAKVGLLVLVLDELGFLAFDNGNADRPARMARCAMFFAAGRWRWASSSRSRPWA